MARFAGRPPVRRGWFSLWASCGTGSPARFSGLPGELAARVPPELWELDWARMRDENRKDIYFELFRDYQSHIDRFPEIARFHKAYQPPALLLWGRHDPYFEPDETKAYRDALDSAEIHLLDGGHFLLETHAVEAAQIIRHFLEKHPVKDS